MEQAIPVAEFDESADNFFAATSSIAELCGTSGEEQTFDEAEIKRFSSMIKFLQEWRQFKYAPKTVNFAYETTSNEVKDAFKGVTLPPFSSAAVPKVELSADQTRPIDGTDFILHAGGPVWALDWCPRTTEKPGFNMKCEYLAVAAHPPGSSYHKIGVPLTGRGLIQIWCLLSIDKSLDPLGPILTGRGSSTKKKNTVSTAVRPRGRPRKTPVKKGDHESDVEELFLLKSCGRPGKRPCLGEKSVARRRGRPRKQVLQNVNSSNEATKSPSYSNNPVSNIDDSVLPPSVDSPGKRVCLEANEKPPASPEGRPQIQLQNVNNLKGAKEPPLRTNNLIANIDKNVLPFSVDSSGKTPSLDANKKSSTRPRGRPGKQFLQNVNNFNGTMELPSCSNNAFSSIDESAQPLPVDTSEKILCLGANKKSSARSSGRPRKQRRQNVNSLNGAMESPSCSNNLNSYIDESVIPLRVDSSEKTLCLGVNKESSARPARPRGRPKKQILQNSSNLNEIMESPSGNTNPISDIDESLPPLSPHSGEVSLALHASTDLNGKEELVKKKCSVLVRNRRGGPRREPFPNVNKSVSVQGAELGEDEATVSAPIKLGNTSAKVSSVTIEGVPVSVAAGNEQSPVSRSRRTKKKPVLNDCVQVSAVVSEKDALPLPVQTDLRAKNVISVPRKRGRPRKEPVPVVNDCVPQSFLAFNETPTTILRENCETTVSAICHLDGRSSMGTCEILSCNDPDLSAMVLRKPVEQNTFPLSDACSSFIPNDVALPRIVLCLAHDGKVAWDVKWRPSTSTNSDGNNHIGYLAVLLGNGSLEVWEVPLLSMVKNLFGSCSSEGTDPRFMKLEPVFRCSEVKCGDRQSIPLTLEWSSSANPDLLLVGCHDGTVALWKFSTDYPSQDTKPLLCFSADSVPIRAIAWAPDDSDVESANLIATAGHEGLKFWDIRDPYRPLWEINPVQRVILGLDWLKNPRCIILSFDDGNLRIISLWNAAYDVPVTGKPYIATKQLGMHSYPCLSFAIWSVQVSQTTGIVAYCGADGSALRFQLTRKAVEKDSKRYHEPHFLCGLLIEEGETLKITTPVPDTPLPDIPVSMKKSPNDLGDAPRTICTYLAGVHRTQQVKTQLPACSGNDRSIVLLSGDAQDPMKSKTLKSPTSTKKKPKPNPSPVSGQLVLSGDADEGTQQVKKIEVLPPKIVAMHRVRWNKNKGSERWLCYGGAAGIIRCQEIADD